MHKITIGKVIGIFVLLFILYVFCGVVFPPLKHKKVEYKALEAAAGVSEENGAERILCLDDNKDALLWRLKVIEEAQDEIIFSTFDFRDDNSGRDIMAALYHASGRNVQVKILVDGINGFLYLKNNPHFRALVAQPNVEAKFYNPVNLLTPWTLNYRMHDKYLIADDMVYILGGRNTNDLFLGDYTEKQNIDRDILVYEAEYKDGNTLPQLKEYFHSIWELSCNRELNYRKNKRVLKAAKELEEHYEALTAKEYGKTDWMQETMEVEKIRLYTNPIEAENKEPQLWYRLQQLMMDGKEVTIQTPYIICSQDMYDGLSLLAGDGRQVRIMINAIESGANPFGCIDYVNQKEKILDTGVEMYECIAEHSLHTKTILVDDRTSIVGSYNLDMRSTYLDTEMMLVIESPALNQSLREQTEELTAKAVHVLPDGSRTCGEDYPDIKLSSGKKFFYQILKVVIRPFRHLL